MDEEADGEDEQGTFVESEDRNVEANAECRDAEFDQIAEGAIVDDEAEEAGEDEEEENAENEYSSRTLSSNELLNHPFSTPTDLTPAPPLTQPISTPTVPSPAQLLSSPFSSLALRTGAESKSEPESDSASESDSLFRPPSIDVELLSLAMYNKVDEPLSRPSSSPALRTGAASKSGSESGSDSLSRPPSIDVELLSVAMHNKADEPLSRPLSSPALRTGAASKSESESASESDSLSRPPSIDVELLSLAMYNKADDSTAAHSNSPIGGHPDTPEKSPLLSDSDDIEDFSDEDRANRRIPADAEEPFLESISDFSVRKSEMSDLVEVEMNDGSDMDGECEMDERSEMDENEEPLVLAGNKRPRQSSSSPEHTRTVMAGKEPGQLPISSTSYFRPSEMDLKRLRRGPPYPDELDEKIEELRNIIRLNEMKAKEEARAHSTARRFFGPK